MMNDSLNIIGEILDNKSNYTKLKIKMKHIHHLIDDTDGMVRFFDSVRNALLKNEHINELIITRRVGWYMDQCEINSILSVKNFKSIYIGMCSLNIYDFLNENTNDNLEKLRLSSCSDFYHNREGIFKHKSLKILDLIFFNDQIVNILRNVLNIIKQTNVIELILRFSENFSKKNKNDMVEYFKIIFENKKLRRLNIHDEHFIEYKKEILKLFKSNNELIDFTINGEHNEMINITERNKKYLMTIFLCGNKRIVPRCVFRDLILVHII